MAHYTDDNYHNLTLLAENDNVTFRIADKILHYRVARSHLQGIGHVNRKIFLELGKLHNFDAHDYACKKFNLSDSGSWPSSTDMEKQTSVVIWIFIMNLIKNPGVTVKRFKEALWFARTNTVIKANLLQRGRSYAT